MQQNTLLLQPTFHKFSIRNLPFINEKSAQFPLFLSLSFSPLLQFYFKNVLFIKFFHIQPTFDITTNFLNHKFQISNFPWIFFFFLYVCNASFSFLSSKERKIYGKKAPVYDIQYLNNNKSHSMQCRHRSIDVQMKILCKGTIISRLLYFYLSNCHDCKQSICFVFVVDQFENCVYVWMIYAIGKGMGAKNLLSPSKFGYARGLLLINNLTGLKIILWFFFSPIQDRLYRGNIVYHSLSWHERAMNGDTKFVYYNNN